MRPSPLMNLLSSLALSALMADSTFAHAARGPAPHFVPKAKNVIFLFMDGGVSHVDSFDPKPMLDKYHGKVGDIKNAQSQVGGERAPSPCCCLLGRG